MATLKTPAVLAADAETLATSFEYVLYSDRLYAPVDYETGDDTLVPPVARKCWKPLSTADVQVKARDQFDTVFKNPAQLAEFVSMTSQACAWIRVASSWLMIRTADGLKVLRGDGKLYEPDGRFVPNLLAHELNEDPDDKAEVLSVITEWLGSEEEEAISLLRHLATTLAPHWSAGKYVLLIGDGRNGKSLLMSMLRELFGQHNCSNVDRQTMAARDNGCFDLNGKLLNLVYDGSAEFIKDSGTEKSIITGEPVSIRKLYDREQSVVQTNALFMEGLNQEPKSKDKTSALQARLVRYWFPNKYADDEMFKQHMTSPRMLGALLSLMIDNYVTIENKSVMLAPSALARQLQLEHMEDNSVGMQYILYLEETDPLGAEAALVGQSFDVLVQGFNSWRVRLNDLEVWDPPRLINVFRPVLSTVRRSARIAGKTNATKVRFITELKRDTLELIASVKEEDNASTPMVED